MITHEERNELNQGTAEIARLKESGRVAAMEKWLKEKARHTIHCGWKDSRYQVELGCTCGLADLLGEDK